MTIGYHCYGLMTIGYPLLQPDDHCISLLHLMTIGYHCYSLMTIGYPLLQPDDHSGALVAKSLLVMIILIKSEDILLHVQRKKQKQDKEVYSECLQK